MAGRKSSTNGAAEAIEEEELGAAMACDLPGDLIIEMASRLPVKSLMRFKCINKAWCSLVTQPFFINSHLNQSNLNTQNSLLVMRQNQRLKKQMSVISYQTLQPEARQEIPYSGKKFLTLGCCNGILLFVANYMLTRKDYILYNPATGEMKVVPRQHKFSTWNNVNVGFGFDPKTNDYKIVRLENFDGVKTSGTRRCDVYSLNSDTWKQVELAPTVEGTIVDRWCQTFVNGSLHWQMCGQDDKLMIMSYDINKQTFGQIEVPDVWVNQTSSSSRPRTNLYVLKDRLALVTTRELKQNDDNTHGTNLEIWIMNEYGVKESWFKLMNVGPCPGSFYLLGGFGSNQELVFYNVQSCGLEVYDPSSQEIRSMKIEGPWYQFEVLNYKASLVRLNGRYEDVNRDFANDQNGPRMRPTAAAKNVDIVEEALENYKRVFQSVQNWFRHSSLAARI